MDEQCVTCLPSLALRTICRDTHITGIHWLWKTHTKFHWAFWLGSLHSDSEATSPCVSRAQRMYRMSTSLAWIWTWRCFAFFVLSLYIVLPFLVLFYATLLWREIVSFVEWFYCHHSLLSGCHEDQRLRKTSGVRFISKLWCAWGSNCDFWSRDRLDDDIAGRCRYESFVFLFAVIRQEKYQPSKMLARALKELSCVFKQSRKLMGLKREHISNISRSLPKFMVIPVKLIYFVMLCNPFRERTCKHERKRKSYESSERWFSNLSLQKTYKPTVPKVINRPGVFRYRNHRIN